MHARCTNAGKANQNCNVSCLRCQKRRAIVMRRSLPSCSLSEMESIELPNINKSASSGIMLRSFSSPYSFDISNSAAVETSSTKDSPSSELSLSGMQSRLSPTPTSALSTSSMLLTWSNSFITKVSFPIASAKNIIPAIRQQYQKWISGVTKWDLKPALRLCEDKILKTSENSFRSHPYDGKS